MVPHEGRPERKEWDLGLVGKGVTYDSGGISLKTDSQQIGEKKDMCGAAAVAAAMKTAALQKLPLNLIAVLPSVIIIILVSRALDRFRSSSLVQNGFYGLRPASAGLIFGAMFTVFAGSLLHLDLWSGPESLLSVLNYRAILLFLVLSVAIRKLPKVHPIVFIGVGALAGIVFQF